MINTNPVIALIMVLLNLYWWVVIIAVIVRGVTVHVARHS